MQLNVVSKRWRSPLLWVILGQFGYLALSGFGIFFLRPLIGEMPMTSELHWIIGLIFFVPYVKYQIDHYRGNLKFAAQLHYKIGLATLASVIIVSISGALLLVKPTSQLIDMLHILSGFAFLVCIAAHLALVIRLRLLRSGKGGAVNSKKIQDFP